MHVFSQWLREAALYTIGYSAVGIVAIASLGVHFGLIAIGLPQLLAGSVAVVVWASLSQLAWSRITRQTETPALEESALTLEISAANWERQMSVLYVTHFVAQGAHTTHNALSRWEPSTSNLLRAWQSVPRDFHIWISGYAAPSDSSKPNETPWVEMTKFTAAPRFQLNDQHTENASTSLNS
jgi:hypothetical protein